MGLFSPLVAIVIAFCILGIMLFKRLNLAIALNVTAIILALLSLSWQEIPSLVFNTTVDLVTVSVVLATFSIMLLSQLYKETGVINRLSDSLSKLVKNPKIVLSVLPAVIGFLPVAGGALMSAPLVDSEAEKLGLKPEKKAYVNLWFRHTIFPVYPLSQILILAAALADTSMSAIILRQIPVVVVMIIVGFVTSFWKVSSPVAEKPLPVAAKTDSNVKRFFIAFLPILVAIIVVVCLELIGFNLSKQGFDVLIASIVGLAVLIWISKPNTSLLVKPLKNWGIYGVTFAAYGALLLGSVIKATGISKFFDTLVSSGSVDTTVLLVAIPAILGVLTASALGGISISMPILGGIVALSPRMASLIFMSAYMGYVVTPTHLCFSFTAQYFKCPIRRIYKYVIPSFLITLATAILMYLLF